MIRTLALLGMLAVLAGCASQAPSDPTPVATADPPPTAAQATPPASTDKVEAKGPPPGWNSKRRAGKIVYCKTVDVTGSHFPQEVCLEPAQLEAVLRQQKKQAERTLDIPVTN